MRLYLVQHGEAMEVAADPDRPLTERGTAGVTRTARFLAGCGLGVDEVWHSGKTRARQTAELLAPAVGEAAGLVERAGLSPKDDVAPVAERLAGAGADLMLVGHLPFLGRLASLLLAGDEDADVVAFRYGCVVCLERDETGAWRVLWMLRPDALSA